MTASLCVAAFLMAAPGIAHSSLGERHILIRLFRLDKSLVISRGQHLSWLVFVVIGGLVLV